MPVSKRSAFLYLLLKIPAKLAFRIYCRHICINDKAMLQSEGPLLIAANHPNSFLDAIVIATLFKKPVHSLARGDVFTNKMYKWLLHSLNMLPVYRVSEGVENLEQNYTTFEACQEIFKKNGIVLIFSEGRCINEWHLRPLKKGTARLAISSWQSGIPLKVLPAGLNYSSFYTFGKNIYINFGKVITMKDMPPGEPQGRILNLFNDQLKMQLEGLVVEVHKTDNDKIKEKFYTRMPVVKRVLLFIPAIVGWMMHFPLYYPIQKIAWKKARHNDHYDSALVGMLFILYPIYLLLIALLMSFFIHWWWLMVVVILPFCAWCYVQVKHQLDKPAYE